MKKGYLPIVALGILASSLVQAKNTVDSVPTEVSMVQFCGITNIDPISFAAVDAGVDAVANGTVMFEIDIECPKGDYVISFDSRGEGFFLPSGDYVTISTSPGGSHVSSDAAHVFSTKDKKTTLRFHATLRSGEASYLTPSRTQSWSGTMPVTFDLP